MSKAVSYYDWELSFKSTQQSDLNKNKKEENLIGISDLKFKDFLKEWKEKNLS